MVNLYFYKTALKGWEWKRRKFILIFFFFKLEAQWDVKSCLFPWNLQHLKYFWNFPTLLFIYSLCCQLLQLQTWPQGGTLFPPENWPENRVWGFSLAPCSIVMMNTFFFFRLEWRMLNYCCYVVLQGTNDKITTSPFFNESWGLNEALSLRRRNWRIRIQFQQQLVPAATLIKQDNSYLWRSDRNYFFSGSSDLLIDEPCARLQWCAWQWPSVLSPLN